MGILERIRKVFTKGRPKDSPHPFIFFEGGAKTYLTKAAEDILAAAGVDRDRFVRRLKRISKHINSPDLAGIEAVIIKIPESDGDVLVYLSEGCAKERVKYGLTKRECEVLACLVKGNTNEEISKCLDISTGTVNSHLDNIYAKLNVSSRLKAALRAVVNGVICPCSAANRILFFKSPPVNCPALLSLISLDCEEDSEPGGPGRTTDGLGNDT